MIPVLLTSTRQEGEQGGGWLANVVLTTLVAFVALVVAVGELVTPAFAGHALAPGSDAQTRHLATNLTRLMLFQPLILAVGSVAIAILNGRNQFLLTAASIASHDIALIGRILATRADPTLGIHGPTLGVVAGAVLQLLLVGVSGVVAVPIAFAAMAFAEAAALTVVLSIRIRRRALVVAVACR